jgi:WD40-like Beta Propeller Repeat
MPRRHLLPTLALLVLPLGAALAGSTLTPDLTVRISNGLDFDEPDADCDRVAMSGNGCYVAFASMATNLVSGDGNDTRDIFVSDTKDRTLERVSIGSGGEEGDASSTAPVLSASGRLVAFASSASNLVADDDNGVEDVFVHDRKTGETTRISLGAEAVQADDESDSPAISASGRFVAFASDAENLVPGDTNDAGDIFVHDRKTGATTRVSVATFALQANDVSFAPAISANGRWVAFRSRATDLVPGDANGSEDVFLHDRKTGTTIVVSVDAAGDPQGECVGRVALSAKGRHVLFHSDAAGLVEDDGNTDEVMDSFVFDRKTGTVERVTLGPDDVEAEDGDGGGGIFAYTAALSGNGRYAVFPSAATNLVAGGTDGPQHIYVRDRKLRVTHLVSVGPDAEPGDGDSREAAVCRNGRVVAFSSDAGDLVQGDLLDFEDVFVRKW